MTGCRNMTAEYADRTEGKSPGNAQRMMKGQWR